MQTNLFLQLMRPGGEVQDQDHLLEKSLENRCFAIEDLLLQLGQNLKRSEQDMMRDSATLASQLHDLINQQKQARIRKDNVMEVAVSKLIQKEMRALLKARKNAKIDRILSQFRDIKQICMVKRSGKHDYIGSVTKATGELQHDRQLIADVFSDFYSDLYARREEETPMLDEADVRSVPTITVKELRIRNDG